MSNIVMIKCQILIDSDKIQDIHCLEYIGSYDEELTGKYFVRVLSKEPCVDIVCGTIEDMQKTYINLIKSQSVVDINKMRRK